MAENKRQPPVSYARCGSSSVTLGSEQPESGYEGPGRGLWGRIPKGKEPQRGGGLGAFKNRDMGKR